MLQQRRVFFIDDDPHVLDGLRRALHEKRAEWEMLFFENARSALEAHRAQPADLVVTDLVMPGTDGLELLSDLRRGNPGLRVIVFSGSTRLIDELVIPAALRMGAAKSMRKPLDASELMKAIEELLA